MQHILIFDTNSDFLDILSSLVLRFSSKHNIRIKINSFSSAHQISTYFLCNCDIAFLVLHHNKSSKGFSIAKSIKQCNPDAAIVFISQYTDYAPKAFELPAFRYILKDSASFQNDIEEALQSATNELSTKRERIKVLSNRELIAIDIKEILYFESFQHQIKIWITSNTNRTKPQCLPCYSTLKSFEEILSPLGFLRVQKSFLVNMQRILRFQRNGVLLDNGATLSVSAKYYKVNKREYLQWKEQQ